MNQVETGSPDAGSRRRNPKQRDSVALQKRLRLAGWAALAMLVVFVGWLGWLYLYELPSFSQLREYKPQLVTRLYARDGSTFQEYYLQRRILVPYDRIPPYLVDALLSAEDRSFFSHWGFDLRGF